MSKIKVGTITNVDDTSPVIFPTGVSGDGSKLTFEPKVVSFDPLPLATGISTTTNITVTFDQQIQFSGVGTIYIRESTSSGTISTYFTCGVSTEATIAGETLVINPRNPIDFAKTYYVTLPSVGIANTFGAYYKGTVNYQFQTAAQAFSAVGGNHEFTIASAPSPTGYYKYHVFTSTGILTTTDSTVNADSLSAVLVAGGGAGGWEYTSPSGFGKGGGGAGGLLSYTGPTLALAGGVYTITIGAGGANSDPVGNSAGGSNSTIGTPSSTIITTFGGGGGGMAESPPRGPLSPVSGQTANTGEPGGSGGGGASNGYAGGNGVPGQGNSGGSGDPAALGAGGGGGGAGGSGTPGTAGGPTNVNNGGPGAPNPAFASPLIAPYVPTIPSPSISKIGPSGLFAGGGGGGPSGSGGPGGGGISWGNNPVSGGEPGYQNTGGGGGAGNLPTSRGGLGGSGVFMIRYAVPAP